MNVIVCVCVQFNKGYLCAILSQNEENRILANFLDRNKNGKHQKMNKFNIYGLFKC